MEDKILKDILDYATKKINAACGYCGVAEGDRMAMLNSDDGKGNDIIINFRLEAE